MLELIVQLDAFCRGKPVKHLKANRYCACAACSAPARECNVDQTTRESFDQCLSLGERSGGFPFPPGLAPGAPSPVSPLTSLQASVPFRLSGSLISPLALPLGGNILPIDAASAWTTYPLSSLSSRSSSMIRRFRSSFGIFSRRIRLISFVMNIKTSSGHLLRSAPWSAALRT